MPIDRCREKNSVAKTKITFKVHTELWSKFSKSLDSSFIRRDSFLSHVLGIESSHIKKSLKGLKLSRPVKAYISREFKMLNTTQVSIQLDEEVAQSFNAIIKEHNLVRDAVLNRLLMYLWSADGFLDAIEVPRIIDEKEEVPTSPVKAIAELIDDPLKTLRNHKDEDGYGIYNSIDLLREYPGFICYMDEEYLPENLDKLLELF